MTIVWCMVPGIWSLMDRMFCHFGPFFTLLPPKNPKNHNFEKKRKKRLKISFYTNVRNIMIICYAVPEIGCVTDVILIFHFGLFFALLTPNDPKSQNLERMKKTRRTDGQTDGQTDGRKKWHVEVGATPKRNYEFCQIYHSLNMNNA